MIQIGKEMREKEIGFNIVSLYIFHFCFNKYDLSIKKN